MHYSSLSQNLYQNWTTWETDEWCLDMNSSSKMLSWLLTKQLTMSNWPMSKSRCFSCINHSRTTKSRRVTRTRWKPSTSRQVFLLLFSFETVSLSSGLWCLLPGKVLQGAEGWTGCCQSQQWCSEIRVGCLGGCCCHPTTRRRNSRSTRTCRTHWGPRTSRSRWTHWTHWTSRNRWKWCSWTTRTSRTSRIIWNWWWVFWKKNKTTKPLFKKKMVVMGQNGRRTNQNRLCDIFCGQHA